MDISRATFLEKIYMIVGLLAGSFFMASCGREVGVGSADSKRKVVIIIEGSDTMVPLINLWAEEYQKVASHVLINSKGGGSSVGIAALHNGTAELCSSSREIKAEERENIKRATGKDVKEYVVAYDALAIYVHKENPLKEISIDELREIWFEDGSIKNWSQIGGAVSEIILVGRQSNSGTYDYFREHIGGKKPDGKQRELKLGISELHSSSEVIDTISKTKSALGYSGMGFKNDSVAWLAVSLKKGESAVLPNAQSTKSGLYPISRKLYIYTVGEPEGEVKAFLDWVLSSAGQSMVAKEQFVPVN